MIVTATPPAIIPNPQEPAKPADIQAKAETRRPTEAVNQADNLINKAVRDDDDQQQPQQEASNEVESSPPPSQDVYSDPRVANAYQEISAAGSYVDEFA